MSDESEVDPNLANESHCIRCEVVVERTLNNSRRIVSFIVGKIYGKNWRLDRYLHALLPTMSRGLLSRWIEQGFCRVDDKLAECKQRVRAGQKVILDAPVPPPETQSEIPPLQIIYHHQHVIAVNKPPGVLAHQAGKRLSGTLLNQLQDMHANNGGNPKDIKLINRIDCDTSGIVLASSDEKVNSLLSIALQKQHWRKEYLALVENVPHPEKGSWEEAIDEDPHSKVAMRVYAKGKPSKTDYWLIEQIGQKYAYIGLRLHTGRQHQIRVHASFHNCPLIGDWLYGYSCAELPGQALHAHLLEFVHPLTQEKVSITAELPEKLKTLWEHLKNGGSITKIDLTDEQKSKMNKVHEENREIHLPSWLSKEEYEKLSNKD